MTVSKRFRTAGLLLVGVALLVACNGDGDATSTSAATASTSLTTEPAGATAPSTSPSTTSPSSSTSSTSTTTTPEPTTTVDEIALTKQAVAAAAVQSRVDVVYVARNYDAPDALEVLGRTTAANSPSMDVAFRGIESLRSQGWRSRENPDVPAVMTVESEVELLDGPPATRAQLTVCVIDSNVVYDPAAAPDGSDVIINDEIIARRNQITMVLEGGAWKLFEGTNLQTWEGATTCPAA